MVTKYVRPADGLYPIIHHTFMAKNLDGEVVEFNVQDLTNEHIDQAIEFTIKFLTPDETFQKSINLAEKDYAPMLLGAFYRKAFEERVSLACFITGTKELVGLNAMTIKSKGIEDKLEARNFVEMLTHLS